MVIYNVGVIQLGKGISVLKVWSNLPPIIIIVCLNKALLTFRLYTYIYIFVYTHVSIVKTWVLITHKVVIQACFSSTSSLWCTSESRTASLPRKEESFQSSVRLQTPSKQSSQVNKSVGSSHISVVHSWWSWWSGKSPWIGRQCDDGKICRNPDTPNRSWCDI